MKEAGILPCRRQWVWLVEPDRLFAVPEWAREAAVRGLGRLSDKVWLWPTDARKLNREAYKAGWRCLMTRTELRHCSVCSRPMVGIEADQRRKLDESGPNGRLQPCGLNCEREAKIGVWRALNPHARTAGVRARAFKAESEAA